jgi:hypothetical protein
MTEASDQSYFDWLVSQVAIVGKPVRTYNELFERMHNMEFTWTISGDDNRVQDAKDLRYYFLDSPDRTDMPVYKEYVSFLEVLVAISRRMAFIAGGDGPQWAWQLLENLGFDGCSDRLNRHQRGYIEDRLESVIWRTYQRDGNGGFFPLPYPPSEDQTKIEIWIQMQNYINEIREPR